MAIYGLQTFTDNGKKIIDSPHHCLKFRWSKYVNSLASGSEVVSGITGRMPVGCSMAVGSSDNPHIVSIDGDTVSWTPVAGSPLGYYFGSSDSIIYVFLLG